jgi:hypothetical protein
VPFGGAFIYFCLGFVICVMCDFGVYIVFVKWGDSWVCKDRLPSGDL